MDFANPFVTARMGNILKKRFLTGIDPTAKSPTNPMQGVAPIPLLSSDPSQDDEQREASQFYNEIQRIRASRGPSMSMFEQSMLNPPRREDYKPGLVRNIAASLTGFGAGVRNPAEGPAAASAVTDAPFAEAMSDYQTRLQNQATGAQLERQDIMDEIRSLEAARAMGLKYDQYRLAALKNAQQYEVANKNAGIRATEVQGNLEAKADAQALARQAGESLTAYRARMAAVAERNAATGERAQKDTATYRAGQLSVARKRVDAAITAAGAKKISPQQQKVATDLALRELSRDPLYRNFMEAQEENTFEPIKVKEGNEGTTEYKSFIAALKAKVDEIINRSGASSLPEEPTEDDFVVEPMGGK